MRRSADRRYVTSPRLDRLDRFEADFLGDVVEFIAADFFELFAARLELFVDLDGLFGHLLVGFLRATDQGKVRPVVSRLWPSVSSPTPNITALRFFFWGAFAIN